MTGSRKIVLSNIRDSLSAYQKKSQYGTKKPNSPYIRPHYTLSKIDQFLSRAAAVQMTVERLSANADIVQAVNQFIESQGVSAIDVAVDISPELNNNDWSAFKKAAFGRARQNTHYSVTACIAAVAETASIVLASAEAHPSTLNFLPDCHIVVVKESQIYGFLEDVWPIIRGYKSLPRVINFNTGPSRTGDIEQTIEVGAHGPRQMHVLLLAQ